MKYEDDNVEVIYAPILKNFERQDKENITSYDQRIKIIQMAESVWMDDVTNTVPLEVYAEMAMEEYLIEIKK